MYYRQMSIYTYILAYRHNHKVLCIEVSLSPIRIDQQYRSPSRAMKIKNRIMYRIPSQTYKGNGHLRCALYHIYPRKEKAILRLKQPP